MINCVILGTIALDMIRVSKINIEKRYGGTAIYASFAASLFSEVGIISIIGNNFPKDILVRLNNKEIDTNHLQIKGKTFEWEAEYNKDMNEAKTLRTDLNCLIEFNPIVPDEYKKAEYVFIGNTDPEHQLKIISQFDSSKIILLDTMNFWIDSKRDKLLEVISKVDILIINDQEARSLFNKINLKECAAEALKLGLKSIIIKKGEHGVMIFDKDNIFIVPGYPLDILKDPTGCGDSFGGTVIGYLAKNEYSFNNLKKALLYATAIASYNAQGFGSDIIESLTHDKIQERVDEIINLTKI